MEHSGAFEWEIGQTIARVLEDHGLAVQAQPLVGRWRPDLLVQDPDGKTFVVEMKFGRGSTHFGAVAQLASLTDGVRGSDFGSDDTRAILITSNGVPGPIRGVAEDIGVNILEVGPEETAFEIADDLLRYLDVADGPEPNTGSDSY